MSGVQHFVSNQSGAALAEYSLLMGLAALAVSAAGHGLATAIKGSFDAAAAAISSGAGPGSHPFASKFQD